MTCPNRSEPRCWTELASGGSTATSPGPLKTAVDHEEFDEIHLLSNYDTSVHAPFKKWLGGRTTIHAVELTNPTDYAKVFEVADRFLAEVTTRAKKDPTELCIHLSPGTPAMAATWVLLGKSRYPASFYQSHKGRLWQTEIPFDLAVDFVPQLLRDADTAFQHLASKSPRDVEGFKDLVGESRSIRLAVGRAQRAAVRDVPILILGESGTGKEMFARAIHAASPRRSGPFVPINCAAIPRELLEAELFGHAKGAFTGALADRRGAFKRADGGTLFLDELGECDPQMQTKLLRVLQPPPGKGPCHRDYAPVGADKPDSSDVRVIAATNCDLMEAINQNRFREDLYYRLAAISVKLPPLQDRKSDIPLIAESVLRQINADFLRSEPGYEDKIISPSAILFLQRQPWPGNIRQLQNVLVQAAIFCDGPVIQSADLAESLAEVPRQKRPDALDQPLGDGFDLTRHLEDIQSLYLERAMAEAGGVKTRAAELLGYDHYQTLDAQLKRAQRANGPAQETKGFLIPESGFFIPSER